MAKPYERLLVIDYETYWDSKTFTLRKMTTEANIRDPRFKVWGMSYKWLGEDKVRYLSGDALTSFLNAVDWRNTAVLAHNAQFDAAILSWYYGHKPAFIYDTLSMSRALYGVEVGNSLAALAERFGLPPKGNAVHSTDGMTALTPEVAHELAEYCKHDTWLCEEIFKRVAEGFPKKELRLIDMTLKMFTDPVLVLDKHMLLDAIHDEREKREALLSTLGACDSDLSSNDKFAQLLKAVGVTPPLKKKRATPKNPNPEGMIYAFAKNDALFQALINSDREEVALLCEARLAVKSTLERTRAQRFLDVANRGTLPVPLNYYGAHTGRWSASKGSGLNMQNLKRKSFLRKAIMAPKGHKLVVCDLSQIEPRVLAWLCGYQEMLDIFSSGQDAYAMFARSMFGIPDLTKESHPVLRQSAKSALLGAGYGLGWASFAAQLLTGFLGAPPMRYDKEFAKQLGVTKQDMLDFIGYAKNVERALEIPRTCSDQELLVHCVSAKKIIDKYRATATSVTAFWNLCSSLIESSLHGKKEYAYKCLIFKDKKIMLPNGMALKYDGLQPVYDDRGRVQWRFGVTDRIPHGKKLYGGSMTENIVQAVARCVMTDGMLRIQKRYPIVLTVHDEVVCVVPEAQAEEAQAWIHAQMVKEPSYMPGIPLAAESDTALRYGDAK